MGELDSMVVACGWPVFIGLLSDGAIQAREIDENQEHEKLKSSMLIFNVGKPN
jgi:hypothetical protein